ncbi:class I SAM-dependent RNA methyltransferase [Arcanobacterium haemolyticum]|nr:class I SAM-dependent RNA methyltransferase [Arcanobacterium haemolyticum]
MPTIDVELTDIAHGGVAVGHYDGRAVFARCGLPGETVRVAVTKERSKLIRGDVIDVLAHPSPHRVENRWKAAGPLGVGGADLGHVAFDYQAEWKTHVLRSNLRRVGGQDLVEHLEARGIDARVTSCRGDDKTLGWQRRTRVEFVIDRDGNPAMYREGSHELVAIDENPLAVDQVDDLDVFSGAWRRFWAPGDRVRAVVPSGSDPLVVVERQTYAFPGIETDPYVREDVVVDGELYTYRVHATGFWQVHERAGEELIAMVMRGAAVEPGDAVVELYSGAGLLTQPLALATGRQGSVRTFEGSRQGVEDARANTRDLPWVTTRTQRVDARLVQWEPGNVVVADPPRSGLGIDVATALAHSPARRIVLVSCDPAAMARDVATMVESGRRVTSIESVDLFPMTHHFEVVTTLD